MEKLRLDEPGHDARQLACADTSDEAYLARALVVRLLNRIQSSAFVTDNQVRHTDSFLKQLSICPKLAAKLDPRKLERMALAIKQYESSPEKTGSRADKESAPVRIPIDQGHILCEKHHP